jgi:ATP synthase protein I
MIARPRGGVAEAGECFHKRGYTGGRFEGVTAALCHAVRGKSPASGGRSVYDLLWRPDEMAKKDRDSLSRTARSLQDNASRAGTAAGASYTLVGAIILLGGLGYLVDRWRGTSPWFLLGGLALGIVVGFYELVKTTWQR